MSKNGCDFSILFEMAKQTGENNNLPPRQAEGINGGVIDDDHLPFQSLQMPGFRLHDVDYSVRDFKNPNAVWVRRGEHLLSVFLFDLLELALA